MERHRFSPGFLLFVSLWILSLVCAGRSVAAPFNILLIVADDLGYGDLGCYGSDHNRTPRIDQLASGGVRFSDFHSSGPMCTPSRVSILTGRYQQRYGPAFDGPLSGEENRDAGLPQAAVTLAELLQSKGYVSGCFGKWHLGFQSPFLPLDQGFHEFRGLVAGDGDHRSHIDRYGNEDWWRNDHVEMERGYTTDLLTQHSVAFMKKNRERPFFLYVPHLAIHFPWQGPSDPPHRVRGKDYKSDKWGIIPDRSNVKPHVKAMVEAIDRSTGQILDALNALELTDTTLVLFTSDNGGYLNYGGQFQNISSNGPLRGQKGTLYEGGHRVPLIAWLPGVVKKQVCNATAHSNDLMPTIAHFAGVERAIVKSDGIDLSGLLRGDATIPPRTLYWRAGGEWAIREGAWKLVSEQQGLELFNLDNDLAEQKDLSHQHPELVARLREQWNAWNREMPTMGREE